MVVGRLIMPSVDMYSKIEIQNNYISNRAIWSLLRIHIEGIMMNERFDLKNMILNIESSKHTL